MGEFFVRENLWTSLRPNYFSVKKQSYYSIQHLFILLPLFMVKLNIFAKLAANH